MVIVMVICLTSCANTSKTANVDDVSGSYGSLTWSYTKESKTLAINGVGDMPAAQKATEVAWDAVRLGVEKVVIDKNITSVGDFAFYGMRNLKSIELHSGITAIGKGAFSFCVALETVIVPAGVTSVGESAFEGCSELKVVQLPASTVDLGARAFAFCGKLETAHILGALTAINDMTFYSCMSLGQLMLNPATANITPAESAFEKCNIVFANATFTETEDGTSIITIKYLDTEGNELRPEKKLDVALGEAYNEVSPKIDGYTADKLTVAGTGTGVDDTVTVTYTADPVESETPPADTDPVDVDEGFGAGDVAAIIIFVVVIAAIGVAGFLLVRSDKKKTTQTVRKNVDNGKNTKNNKKK